jgi:iron complex transport system permease protein
LTCLVLIGRFGKFASEHILLGGIALSVLSSAALAILMTKGDPRIGFLLSWMTGSTYRTTLAEAELAAVIAFCLLVLSPLLARWLLIMPLGEPVERMLGVPVSAARMLVLLAAAIATATATLIVGPLSFVGLLAPHLARQLGFRRPVEQLVAGTLLGAAIMVLADWLGRVAAYPWQVPSGLIATLVGGLLFVSLLARSPSTHGACAIAAGQKRPARDGDR